MPKELEVKNAEDLIKSVKKTVSEQINDLHKKYEDEVNANGKANVETVALMKKFSEKYSGLADKNDQLKIELKELSQKLTNGFNQGPTKAKIRS